MTWTWFRLVCVCISPVVWFVWNCCDLFSRVGSFTRSISIWNWIRMRYCVAPHKYNNKSWVNFLRMKEAAWTFSGLWCVFQFVLGSDAIDALYAKHEVDAGTWTVSCLHILPVQCVCRTASATLRECENGIYKKKEERKEKKMVLHERKTFASGVIVVSISIWLKRLLLWTIPCHHIRA